MKKPVRTRNGGNCCQVRINVGGKTGLTFGLVFPLRVLTSQTMTRVLFVLPVIALDCDDFATGPAHIVDGVTARLRATVSHQPDGVRVQ